MLRCAQHDSQDTGSMGAEMLNAAKYDSQDTDLLSDNCSTNGCGNRL